MNTQAQCPQHDIRWLAVRNVASQDAPAFACLAVVGVDPDGTFQVAPPKADGQQALIGYDLAIKAGGCGSATGQQPVLAAFDARDGTPQPGEAWGAAAGSWLLRKGRYGFLVESLGPGPGQVWVKARPGGRVESTPEWN